MTVEKAMERLFWRMQNGSFYPNQNDFDATVCIAKWINREKEKRVNENRYFGKLFVYTLMREIDWYEDTRLAEDKIHQILKSPLEYWYDRFRMMVVSREFMITTYALGIDDISTIWDRNKDANGYLDMDKIREETKHSDALVKEHHELLMKALTKWDQPEITKKLNHMISELLNEYGNKP